MILDATTKSLTIVLGEARTTTDCDLTASWGDQTPDEFVPGNNTLVSNGTGAVTVVPAPAVAGIQRQVQEVTAYNNDTVSHTMFLREHDGANTRVILEATLAPGASFRYPQSSVPTGGTVTNIATTFGITGGPITNSGTISSTGQAINTQSAGYTAANSDIGKVINMTSSSAATLTLNPAVLTADWWCYVNCALSGSSAAAKVLTYTPSSGTFDGAAAGHDYPGAQRIIQFDGTNFNSILLRGGFLEVQNSDSPFTAQLPTGVNMHKFMCLGAGGAGASGRRGAAGSARGGGSGGGGGGLQFFDAPAAYVSSALVFTVPAGPAGGLAITADSTDGNPGSAAAGPTFVTSGAIRLLQGGAGGPGGGGLAATATSGGAGGGNAAGAAGGTSSSQGGIPSLDVTILTTNLSAGQIGGANGIVGTQGSAAGQGGASGGGTTATGSAGTLGFVSVYGGSSGGSGGGISAGNAASAGGNGGGGNGTSGAATGGAAGTSGVAGGTGGGGTTTPSPVGRQQAGAGGGSGFDNTASGTASAAGPGGNGGIGSGGGGGGASLNGNNSGAGGSGGNGLARWWYS